MATIKFGKDTITADPVEQLPNGYWLMRSRVHTARLSVGTIFQARPDEVIEMAAAEMPANAPIPQDLLLGPVPEDKVGMAALEAAMADERKTLPSPSELLAAHRKSLAEGKTLPDRPIQPRTAGPQPGQGQ